MSRKKDKTLYLVNYRDPKDGSCKSIKAHKIEDSPLGLSFVAISDFVFDSNSFLINPDEEAKKLEFEKIKTFHLSIYSIQSVSEIGNHEKCLSFKNDRSHILVLNQETLGSKN